ncbi:MAG: O-antigen ligase family protein [Ruminococcus flavefaciens]|nr:O-antigen ligase family protein [Ruminococcus flavefaciens]
MKIEKSKLLCTFIILIQLLPSQVSKYWPEINGTIYQLLYYMKYLGAFMLLLYVLTGHTERSAEIEEKNKSIIHAYYPLFCIWILIEMFALFTSPVVETYGVRYWTRCTAYLLDKVCILIEIFCLHQICKEKTIDYLTDALLIDGYISVIITIFRTGLVATIKVIPAVFGFTESQQAMKSLEVHELTYCLAICLIFYLFFKRNKSRAEIWKVIQLILLFIFGGKRIAFAGLLVSGLFAFFVRRNGLSRKMIFIVGGVGCSICIAWIAILYDGRALMFFNDHNINVMGRDSIWSYFLTRTQFSLDSFGWGLASTTKAIEDMTREEVGNMVNIRGLHNDILKMYIDCGFIGFCAWLIFEMISFPMALFRKFGRKITAMYVAMTIFTFISYMTSNIEGAFIYQVTLLLIPFALGDMYYISTDDRRVYND